MAVKKPEPDEAQQAEPVHNPQKEPINLGAFQQAFEVANGRIQAWVKSYLEQKLGSLEPVDAGSTGQRLDNIDHDMGNVLASVGALAEDVAKISGGHDGLLQRIRRIEDDMASETVVPQETFDATIDGLSQRLDTLESMQRTLGVRFEDLAGSVPWGQAPEPADPRTVATPAVPGVLRKFLALTRRVSEIGKERTGHTGKGGTETYLFRGVDDAMNAVGIAQREVGLVLRTEVIDSGFELVQVPRMWNGKQDGISLVSISRVTMAYVFSDPDDGSEHRLEMVGAARDTDDKDTSKALAAAIKYAFFHGLNIPVAGQQDQTQGTGMDPEYDHPETTWPATSDADTQPDHQVGDQVTVGGTTFTKHSDWPGFPVGEPGTPLGEETPRELREPEPPDRGQDQAPEQRATAALHAARRAPSLQVINAIIAQAKKEGLLQIEVEGIPLQVAIVAAAKTIPARSGA
jgi:hypothetical protein